MLCGMDIQLLPLHAQSPYFLEAVEIYTAFTGRDLNDSAYHFRSYMHYPGYHGLVAVVVGRAVGMGFGTRSLPGHWWHDQVAARVGSAHPALQDAWLLTELHVREQYRNRQIGGHLHDALIAQQPYDNLLLSTPVASAARRFYERHGWHYLHEGFAFVPGDPAYAIMHKKL